MPISKLGTGHHSSFESPLRPDHNVGTLGIDSNFKSRTPVSSGRARTALQARWVEVGRIAQKLRGSHSNKARTIPSARPEESLEPSAYALGSISAGLISGAGKSPLPLALRFIPDVPQSLKRAGIDNREYGVLSFDDPNSPGMAWWRRTYVSIVHRLKSWAAPKGYRALQITHAREKVMSAAYVFLNAMRSGETLGKHFEDLKRLVRRLDRYSGMSSGISEISTYALSEVAHNTAARHDGAADMLECIDRCDLLDKDIDQHGFDQQGFDQEDYLRGDGILFAMEYPMAPGIALYGQALRYIAAVDPKDPTGCDIIRGAVDSVLRREDEVGDIVHTREEWLASAVRRLPNRTLQRLGMVLDTELPCGFADPCETFLRDLTPVVGKHLGARRAE